MPTISTATDVLDPQQLSRIEATHRGFLYQHLFACGCLLKSPAGLQTLVLEHDEDVELMAGNRHIYVQVADSPENDHRSPLIPITILPVSDQRGRSEATLAF